ncbi:MAG: hypothetical protein WB770_12020 [Acidimicrobiales bacterium]
MFVVVGALSLLIAIGGPSVAAGAASLPPRIARATVAAVRDNAAVVDATIVPNGLPTTVYVRFGTTAAFDARSVVHSAGAGDASVALAIVIGGLAPNTTYDFDVVATNAARTRVSAEESFITTGPPTVVGQSVGTLGITSARLGGVIDPDGHSTTWYVQYGSTASYGSRTAISHLGPSMSPIPVRHPVSGLDPNTNYHFRLVVKSADGTVTGGDATFTTLGPTLSTSVGSVTVGRYTALSGTVPFGLANQMVAIYAQATNSPSFVQVASVLTGAGGSWGYNVSPKIDTAYKAVWDNEVTPTVGVSVRPSVRLRELKPGTFYTRVIAATFFAGKMVRLERLDNGTWRTVAFAHLGRTSTAMLHPRKLAAGLSRLRVFFSAYQAGVGYLAGTSRVVHSFHG